jgi:hypothetical protein
MKVELSLEALAGLTSTGQEELKSMIFDEKEDGELALKEDANPDHIVSDLLKGKFKKINDERFKAAHRKVSEQFEQSLKEFGYDGSSQGTEALREFIESVKSQPGNPGKPQEITPEWLEKNPTAKEWYQSRFDQDTEKLRQRAAELEQQIQDQQIQYQIKELRSAAMSKAIEVLDASKWDDGGDLRTKRVQTIQRLLPYDRLTIKDGELVVLDDEGNPLRDDLSNPITFDKYVKDLNPFGTVDYNKKSSPSLPGKPGSASKLTVSSAEQMNQLLAEADKLPAAERFQRRKEITEAYHEHRKSNR